jgi:TonB family protein
MTLDTWQDWEGRVVGGRFALGLYVGGSDHSAVYFTEIGGVRAVVKLVAADNADAEAQLARWEAACRMAHPNLLRVFETGRWHADEERDMFFVVMEYADENLGEILNERALTPGETRELLPPVLDALQHLHEQNLVLGDLKPSNVLAVGQNLKLAADGVRRSGSRVTGREQEDWRAAPEVLKSSVSARNDIWALGLLVAESLTRQRPAWDRAKEEEEVKLPGGLPEPFAGIVQGCLQREPARRCSLADIRKLLNRPAETKPAEVVPIRPETGKGASLAPSRLNGGSAADSATPSAPQQPPAPHAAASPVASAEKQLARETVPSQNTAAVLPPAIAESSHPETERGPEPHERYRSSLSLQSLEAEAQPSGRAADDRQRFVRFAIALLVGVLAIVGLVRIFGTSRQEAKPARAESQPAAQAPGSARPAAARPAAQNVSSKPSSGGVANEVLPEISRAAQSSIHGVVKVKVQANVNEAGDVTVAGLAAHGPSRYFAKQALDAARQWKFAPPVVAGAPVPSRWNIEFAFKRGGVKVDSKMVAPRA